MSKTITNHISEYLDFCQSNKRLDPKTVKAYKIDLTQFVTSLSVSSVEDISSENIKKYIANLHQTFKPKTVKRKIASVKAFISFLDEMELITYNPFAKIHTKFREPVQLPRTIPLPTMELLLSSLYAYYHSAKTEYSRRSSLQAIAIIELLFATGIRISELCSISTEDIDLINRRLKINGKGKKERILSIGNTSGLFIISEYKNEFSNEINASGLFFPVSDQVVRRMIRKHCKLAGITQHITPHMFRHTFASSLLEAGVDLRYIQDFLGHSSISITEIYTHTTLRKQTEILSTLHPRVNMIING